MLYWLTQHFQHHYHFLRVFQYLTFRSILACITALVICLVVGRPMIRRLTALKVGQTIRDDGPQSHLSKAGTPTMGGAMILVSIFLSTVFWGDLSNAFVWLVLIVTIGFGVIGGYDDYLKLVHKNSKGLSAKKKYGLQSIIAIVAALYLFFTADSSVHTQLVVPFAKDLVINLSWFFPILAYFVIVGTSNAVNLTDGLDGLAIMPTVLVSGALGIFAYASGNIAFSTYLAIPYVPGVGEIAVFASAIVGAGLGFLWFNAYPAEVFMGDIGALSLGAALGVMAVVVRQELALLIMGGIFVAETVSVILQVGYFKMTGKRIFRMAPLHHHFELLGWPEPKVIVRFWIISVVLVLVGLATLKLR